MKRLQFHILYGNLYKERTNLLIKQSMSSDVGNRIVMKNKPQITIEKPLKYLYIISL